MRFKPSGAGKGSAYRPVDKKRWDESYDRIYGTDEERRELEVNGKSKQAGISR